MNNPTYTHETTCSCGGNYQAMPNDADRPDGPWHLECDRCGLDSVTRWTEDATWTPGNEEGHE